MKKISLFIVIFSCAAVTQATAQGEATGKRQYKPVKTVKAKPAVQSSSSKTKTNIKDPFNPGSGDDDTRNPFDSAKRVQVKPVMKTNIKTKTREPLPTMTLDSVNKTKPRLRKIEG